MFEAIQELAQRTFAGLPLEQQENWARQLPNQSIVAQYTPAAAFSRLVYVAVEKALRPFRNELRRAERESFYARTGKSIQQAELTPESQANAIQLRMAEHERDNFAE